MKRINRRLFILALPLIIGFLLFYLIPMIGSVRYAFMRSAFDHSFAGLDNFAATINNEYFRLSIKNTLDILLMGVPLLMVVAMILALLIQAMGNDVPALLQAALIMPMLVPSAAISSVFGKMYFSDPRAALLAIFVWKNSGILMLVYISAFSSIPHEIYEAATLDGAGKVRAFFAMTLPMMAGPLLFSMILAASYNLRLFREAYLMYGAYPDNSIYLVQHYMNNHFNKLNYQSLTAAAILLALILFVPTGIGAKLINKLRRK
jgi:multiple sugar transport system permease protein